MKRLIIPFLLIASICGGQITQVKSMSFNGTVDEWRYVARDTVYIHDTIYLDSARLVREKLARQRDSALAHFKVDTSKPFVLFAGDSTGIHNMHTTEYVSIANSSGKGYYISSDQIHASAPVYFDDNWHAYEPKKDRIKRTPKPKPTKKKRSPQPQEKPFLAFRDGVLIPMIRATYYLHRKQVLTVEQTMFTDKTSSPIHMRFKHKTYFSDSTKYEIILQ